MTEFSEPHGQGTLTGLRPRSYRTATHLVYEGESGEVYRIDLRRLRRHSDVLRVVRWLLWQPGFTARSLDQFIQVVYKAAELDCPH